MIRSVYTELFSFAVRNSFYRNGQNLTSPNPAVQEDFDILCTKTTEALIRQFGMVFRRVPNGFKLFSETTETAPSILSVVRKPKSDTRLTFILSLKNKGVLSFSEVAFRELSMGQIYYFNNLPTNTDARDDLRLSTQPAVNLTDDLIRLRTSAYAYEMPGVVSADAVKVIAVNGADLVVPKSATRTNGKTLLSFDLSSLPEGRYQLEVSGSVKDTFFYGGNRTDVFAVFEAFFKDAQPNYQILETDFSLSPARPKYMLKLTARKTFWRYTIRMERNVLTSPFVEISDSSTVFSGVTPTPKLAIFTSVSEIESREDPLMRGSPPVLAKISLKDMSTTPEKISNLSIPDLSVLREENSKFYSEVTINI
ncbi:hypothetical protein [Dyadobacter arcticus]|uniref:Uncharacterized protein n=1 Tax=Dyadobacter arcticus TaxID=1078754 RepID=A0ABX0UNZ3_9BACT|nr:hypothetical protein [Dyadobacter arcticus]NIJ54707.1 hypothetical protein [Dyadobacter arcticus]